MSISSRIILITLSYSSDVFKLKTRATGSSKEHHWWPVALQQYWTDPKGYLSSINCEGEIRTRKPKNRKIGRRRHGHTYGKGSFFEHNFEDVFSVADNDVKEIVEFVEKISPFGVNIREWMEILKLVRKPNRTIKDIAKYHRIEVENFSRIMNVCTSVLIRSPSARNRLEGVPEVIGLPRSEDVGKVNMASRAKNLREACLNGSGATIFLTFLISLRGRFIFGDGVFDQLTDSVQSGGIRGFAFVPITPKICLYISNPRTIFDGVNAACLFAPDWIVDEVNTNTQIYSKNEIFFRSHKPKICEHFLKGEFLGYDSYDSELKELLDDIARNGRGNYGLFS